MKTRPSSSSLQNGKTRLPSSSFLTSDSDMEFPSLQEEELEEESRRR